MISYQEWIPVQERLPSQAGKYRTLVKPLLEDESYELIQTYTPQAHPAISGWQRSPTTHWSSMPYKADDLKQERIKEIRRLAAIEKVEGMLVQEWEIVALCDLALRYIRNEPREIPWRWTDDALDDGSGGGNGCKGSDATKKPDAPAVVPAIKRPDHFVEPVSIHKLRDDVFLVSMQVSIGEREPSDFAMAVMEAASKYLAQ